MRHLHLLFTFLYSSLLFAQKTGTFRIDSLRTEGVLNNLLQ